MYIFLKGPVKVPYIDNLANESYSWPKQGGKFLTTELATGTVLKLC